MNDEDIKEDDDIQDVSQMKGTNNEELDATILYRILQLQLAVID